MHVRVHFKELPFMMFCIHENVWCVSLEKNSYNRMDKSKCTICIILLQKCWFVFASSKKSTDIYIKKKNGTNIKQGQFGICHFQYSLIVKFSPCDNIKNKTSWLYSPITCFYSIYDKERYIYLTLTQLPQFSPFLPHFPSPVHVWAVYYEIPPD